MTDLSGIQKAIREEQIDGWLFFNLHHIDPISDELAAVPRNAINTRKWFYFVPGTSVPLKICHTVEAGILDHLPGDKTLYTGKSQLERILSGFKGKRYAAQFSENIPSVSYLDLGTAELLFAAGLQLISSSGLIQRIRGILSENEIASHIRAADHLYEIVRILWSRVCDNPDGGLYEKELMEFALKEFQNRHLETEHFPIVASGQNTADPHFDPSHSQKKINSGDVVQFDIWAKEKDGIYADISWIGFAGRHPSKEILDCFEAVICARDEAVRMLESSLLRQIPVTGKDVDLAAREILISKGFEKSIKHRTGHAIDRSLHGWGVNMDGIEFPDDRYILDGSCFSVEPGLYLKDFGMRSEINCIRIKEDILVSGPGIQKDLLLLENHK